jgi:hypothetical protein
MKCQSGFDCLKNNHDTIGGLRQMLIGNFIVFYIPKAEDEIVTVIRVMYGQRYLFAIRWRLK